MEHDRVFQMAASNVRFGPGCTAEIGADLRAMAARRTLVVMDPNLRQQPVADVVIQSLQTSGIAFDIFSEVRIEPTDISFQAAAAAATNGGFDSFVAVGGGSAIDTAKAANLYSTWPADFLTYVNAPVGAGQPVPGPLKPLIAVPTTAGTGSETTAVAVFDFVQQKVKTGISHRFLKPTLGIIDPENTRTLPPAVAAASGLDVLSHALESFTALPYDQRPKPDRPGQRPAYQGANPISDLWSLHALKLMAEFLPRAFTDATDDEARANMLLASTIAGIGFGNAGVHLPHAMAYPVAGMVKTFRPDGYNADHAMVPHGMSVILNTPAVARFTASCSPHRHLQAAAALGANIRDADPDDAGDILAERIVHFMKVTQMPNGLSSVGYTEADIPALVSGTLSQHRLTSLSPRPANETTLTELFRKSMNCF
ncbi:MAG: hydroxyacid-oxoacid transhydrogenase [Planctomycetaceae bacterium]